MDEERIYAEGDGIKITSKQICYLDKVLPLAEIASAELEVIEAPLKERLNFMVGTGIGAAALIVFLKLSCLIAMQIASGEAFVSRALLDDGTLSSFVLGYVACSLFVLWFLQARGKVQPIFCVSLRCFNGEQVVIFAQRNKDATQDVFDYVLTALLHNRGK